jgi:TRAP-type C4-dicarboxylate transport system substrate-binding protein
VRIETTGDTEMTMTVGKWRRRALTLALATATSLGVMSTAAAMDTITAVHAFPKSWVYSKSFLSFVDKANAAGKGVFNIQVRGGPEAIGMFEQPKAIQNGVVDMVYTPCAFYAASVPECDAVSASTIDGPKARANGATKALQAAHEKRMGVHYLGWIDSGIRFNLWSTKEFKTGPAGDVIVEGRKMRGNPIYNAFFTNVLKAQVINLKATDVYTALERGTIDTMGWTQIGVMDASWDKFLKYRLEPAFFSTDLGVIINGKKWASLSQQSRDILTKVIAAYEQESVDTLAALRTKEHKVLEEKGMKVNSLPTLAGYRFVEGAAQASFDRMKERVQKMDGNTASAENVMKLFAPK